MGSAMLVDFLSVNHKTLDGRFSRYGQSIASSETSLSTSD
jgi:hypothetical protein